MAAQRHTLILISPAEKEHFSLRRQSRKKQKKKPKNLQKQRSNFSDTQDSKMALKIALLTSPSFVRNPTYAERKGVLNLQYRCMCYISGSGDLAQQLAEAWLQALLLTAFTHLENLKKGSGGFGIGISRPQ